MLPRSRSAARPGMPGSTPRPPSPSSTRRARFTARKEHRGRDGGYWKAYRKWGGTLHRAYLGTSATLTLERLTAAAAALAPPAPDAASTAPSAPGRQRAGTVPLATRCPAAGHQILYAARAAGPAAPPAPARPAPGRSRRTADAALGAGRLWQDDAARRLARHRSGQCGPAGLGLAGCG